MVIGPNLKNAETDPLLFTMLNKKLLLNQPIDSLPITLMVTNQTSITKSLYHSKISKVLGIISIPLIPLSTKLLLVMSIYMMLNLLMKSDLKVNNITIPSLTFTSLLVPNLVIA